MKFKQAATNSEQEWNPKWAGTKCELKQNNQVHNHIKPN